jgi:hypothetical protein
MGRACSAHGAIINAYKISVVKSEGKRPLRIPRFRGGRVIFKWIIGKSGFEYGLD